MAILPGLPGLQITVRTDERDLPEYPDEDNWSLARFNHISQTKRISSYVECVSDVEFDILYQFEGSSQFDTESVTLHVAIDGKVVASEDIPASKVNKKTQIGIYRGKISNVVTRVSVSELVMQRLQFKGIKSCERTTSFSFEKVFTNLI